MDERGKKKKKRGKDEFLLMGTHNTKDRRSVCV